LLLRIGFSRRCLFSIHSEDAAITFVLCDHG
jgi:hypothetical protein